MGFRGTSYSTAGKEVRMSACVAGRARARVRNLGHGDLVVWAAGLNDSTSQDERSGRGLLRYGREGRQKSKFLPCARIMRES